MRLYRQSNDKSYEEYENVKIGDETALYKLTFDKYSYIGKQRTILVQSPENPIHMGKTDPN